MLSKISVYAAIGMFVMLAAGSAYHFWVVSSMTVTQASLEQQLTSLQADNDKLSSSNESLEVALEARASENESIRAQLKMISQSQREEAQRRAELEFKLRSAENKNRVDAIVAAGGSQKLLNLENRQSLCMFENFGKLGGKCVNGVWVKDGQTYTDAVRGTEQ